LPPRRRKAFDDQPQRTSPHMGIDCLQRSHCGRTLAACALASPRLSSQEHRHMALIEPGKKAPAFSLKDQTGKAHRLADYQGRPVVLYFYPKDDTPGCTKEACAFRD